MSSDVVSIRLPGAVPVTVIDHVSKLHLCTALKNREVLGFDCEGVRLSRVGRLSIVQLSSEDDCFLFDVLNCTKDCEVTLFLKEILEDESIVKIVHDVKMDADACLHILGINITGIHDTQSWDSMFRNVIGAETNLNNTLKFYGCKQNAERSKQVYKDNPSFWATRPLTRSMIKWASGDVRSLFELREIQMSKATCGQHLEGKRLSTLNADKLRTRDVANFNIHQSWKRDFIGKNGENLKRLCKPPFYHFHFAGDANSITKMLLLKVYYNKADRDGIADAKAELAKYKTRKTTNNTNGSTAKKRSHSDDDDYGTRNTWSRCN
jgi:exonuclease 3'-5' domain-containing protein 1